MQNIDIVRAVKNSIQSILNKVNEDPDMVRMFEDLEIRSGEDPEPTEELEVTIEHQILRDID